MKQKLEQEEEILRLKKAIGELETEEQFMITQFYYKGSSIKELATIMGLSESNIKIKLFRAKKKLTSLMTKQK